MIVKKTNKKASKNINKKKSSTILKKSKSKNNEKSLSEKLRLKLKRSEEKIIELNKKYKPRVVEDEFGEKFIKKTINSDDEDLDLEEEVVLAHGMIISWHNSVVLRDRFLKQNLNTSDFQQLSNATMLANNETLHKRIQEDFIKMRIRYRNRDWSGDGFE